MKFRFWFLVCVLCLVSAGTSGFLTLFGQHAGGQPALSDVTNVDTELSYSGIQAAIDAPETLDGHTILVGAGVFMEHVTVNKSISLVGENPDTSIIDGGGAGIVIHVTSNEVVVRNLNIHNGTFGVWLHHSNNSRVIANHVSVGAYGIRLYHSQNSLVTGNRVSGFNHFGIELDSSGNSTLRNNVMADNQYNFGVDGTSLQDFLNDIDVSNTVNGEPVRYLINQRDVIIGPSTFDGFGFLGLVNSSNVKVHDLEVEKNAQGILFAFMSDSSICNVKVRDNWNGIYVAHSSNVSVSEVKSNGNFDYGIKFFNSSGSTALENDVNSNGWAGIGLFGSHNSVLDSNEASLAKYDVHLAFTNNSVVTRNTALIKPGGYSIALYYSHDNLIHRNTFENTLLFIESRNATRFTPRNDWDDGFEGNYWLHYRVSDVDRDGIGDSSYKVADNNVDNRPLMGRYSDYDVALGDNVFNVAFISNSTITELQLNVDEKKISFNAIGQNGTSGFCRIAVPAALLQELGGGDLLFLVNGMEPVLERQWSGEACSYWYLSFANVSSQKTFDPLIIGVIILLILVLAGVVLMFLWKR